MLRDAQHHHLTSLAPSVFAHGQALTPFACIALELSICLSAHLDIEGSSLVGKCIMQECHWLKCHPEMRLKVFKYCTIKLETE